MIRFTLLVLISIDCAVKLAVTQAECIRLYYSSIGASFSAQLAASLASLCSFVGLVL